MLSFDIPADAVHAVVLDTVAAPMFCMCAVSGEHSKQRRAHSGADPLGNYHAVVVS